MEVQRGVRNELQELDVVRALHQTVVSLRSALEASRSELKDLRTKYESHVNEQSLGDNQNIDDNLNTAPSAVDLAEAAGGRCDTSSRRVTFDLSDRCLADDVTVDEQNGNIGAHSTEPATTTDPYGQPVNSKESFINAPEVNEIIINNDETTVKEIQGQFETKLELESKFDVTIKVSALNAGETIPVVLETRDRDFFNIYTSNNRGEPNDGDRVTQTSNESYTIIYDETVLIDNKQDIETMAGSKEGSLGDRTRSSDKLNVHVKITSEEDLLMEPYHAKDSDHLNADNDDISVRSISEGDNSVFSENPQRAAYEEDGKNKPPLIDKASCDNDNMSGNESEEVDDIELIFTTDDTKELTGYQEDLVSISEGEHWAGERSDASTPVLLKFNVFDPETQPSSNNTNTSLKSILRRDGPGNLTGAHSVDESDTQSFAMNVRGPDHRPFLRSSSSKNYLETSNSRNLYRKSFESNDSFSFDNQKSFSFDNTKSSSFERGSSMDTELKELSFDHRDESMDQFDNVKATMKTKFTACLETDISKCGMPDEEGFTGNNNARRNTCPNPFQYRPLSHREVFRGGARPLLAPPGPKVPRRSSAAQTHISALPTQWRSDTHLSKKALPLALTTLPSKVRVEELSSGAAAPVKSSRPSRKSEEARRVLLSDIGFTSMVPELSRSAEPIWAGLNQVGGPHCCAQHATCLTSVPCSPTSPCKQESGHSKYWSKNSMQHSLSGKLGEAPVGTHKTGYLEQGMRWRGSLPELRPITVKCGGGWRSFLKSGKVLENEDCTDELLDEADRFLTGSIGCLSVSRIPQDEFCPSQYSRPYLPSGPRQLKLGHLVKVITPHGRIALGKVRYVGVAGGPWSGSGSAPTYVGLQVGRGATLGASGGDGTFRGRRYFHCEPGKSLFVPFSKVVMAWADY